MLDKVVAYLHARGVPFRLFSDYSPEPLPEVGRPLPHGGCFVQTRVVLLGGRAAIACAPQGAGFELPAIGSELGVDVLEGSPADLPAPFDRAEGPLPPLGTLLGGVTIVDHRVTLGAILCFDAFSTSDRFELLYDDFARIERPRIASFAIGGELPEKAA